MDVRYGEVEGARIWVKGRDEYNGRADLVDEVNSFILCVQEASWCCFPVRVLEPYGGVT